MTQSHRKYMSEQLPHTFRHRLDRLPTCHLSRGRLPRHDHRKECAESVPISLSIVCRLGRYLAKQVTAFHSREEMKTDQTRSSFLLLRSGHQTAVEFGLSE